eukprot:gene4713-4894_t
MDSESSEDETVLVPAFWGTTVGGTPGSPMDPFRTLHRGVRRQAFVHITNAAVTAKDPSLQSTLVVIVDGTHYPLCTLSKAVPQAKLNMYLSTNDAVHLQ